MGACTAKRLGWFPARLGVQRLGRSFIYSGEWTGGTAACNYLGATGVAGAMPATRVHGVAERQPATAQQSWDACKKVAYKYAAQQAFSEPRNSSRPSRLQGDASGCRASAQLPACVANSRRLAAWKLSCCLPLHQRRQLVATRRGWHCGWAAGLGTWLPPGAAQLSREQIQLSCEQTPCGRRGAGAGLPGGPPAAFPAAGAAGRQRWACKGQHGRAEGRTNSHTGS